MRQALHEAGAISAENSDDRHKVKWSAASRTDKGVHAASCVCTVKLLVDPAHVEDPNYTPGWEKSALPQDLVDRWNDLLPADIRILAALRTGRNSRAHNLCSLREYEYLIPESILGGKPPSEIGRLLSVFQGTHRFHNFCGKIPPKVPAALLRKKREVGGEEKGLVEELDELEEEEPEDLGSEGERAAGAAAAAPNMRTTAEAGEDNVAAGNTLLVVCKPPVEDEPPSLRAGREGGAPHARPDGSGVGARAVEGEGGGEEGDRIGGEQERQVPRRVRQRIATQQETWAWPLGDGARLHAQTYVRTIYQVIDSSCLVCRCEICVICSICGPNGQEMFDALLFLLVPCQPTRHTVSPPTARET